MELEKVLPEFGTFSLIKSAIIKSVNPDGNAKLNSPNPIRKLVTIQQVAKLIFHIAAGSMTPYVKDWGEPVIRQSGQTKAKYDLEAIRPTLKMQRPFAKDDEWNALEADATES